MSGEPRIGELVEHVFRHRYGQMVASLTRVFGPEHLDLVEDVVQEAMLKALKQWPFRGVPDHPGAWLVRVAKNLALDQLRRAAWFAANERDVRDWAERSLRELDAANAHSPATEGFVDDQLRMICMCCHEAIPADARVALTLKTLGGFSVREIARAFLVQEAAIAQRLVRAKKRIREAQVPFEMPLPRDLATRLDWVLEVLYLMFNEGYAAHQGEDLVRHDLVRESMRLTALLLEHAATALPKVHALYALMAFQAARLPTRVDRDGNLLLLAEQDRTRWNLALIQLGFRHLQAAGRGAELSSYHLQAGIASHHALAPSYAQTNWPAIRALYDLLLECNPSPVVALNRAVALAKERGPSAGLEAIAEVADHPALKGYYLLPATCGELWLELGDLVQARACFTQALTLPCTEPERELLLKKIASC